MPIIFSEFSSNKYLPKAKKLLKIVAQFFSFQILIQGVDALSGILIIRQLAKTEYAYFGIASTVAVSVINIGIGGLGSYIISEGIKLKEYTDKFSSMFAEVQQFIVKKKWIVISISLPIIAWLFIENQLANYRIIFFILLIVTDVLLRIRMQLLQSILNIWEKYNSIQAITLSGSIARILLVLSLSFFFTAEIAYASLVLSYAMQLFLLRKYSKKYLTQVESFHTGRFPVLQKLYLSQLPINLYNYIDAQLGVFIVTFLGNTVLLADINAAGKLNLIVIAVNAFINNFMIVQFAKIQQRDKFIKLILFTCAVFILIYFAAILLIHNFSEYFIWLIGDKYKNIAPLLYLTVIAICISNFSGLIYSINYSKMWIQKNWVAIPITIFIQVIMLKYMPPNSFEAVWHYAIISSTPTLLINIYYCIKGIQFLPLNKIERF